MHAEIYEWIDDYVVEKSSHAGFVNKAAFWELCGSHFFHNEAHLQ